MNNDHTRLLNNSNSVETFENHRKLQYSETYTFATCWFHRRIQVPCRCLLNIKHDRVKMKFNLLSVEMVNTNFIIKLPEHLCRTISLNSIACKRNIRTNIIMRISLRPCSQLIVFAIHTYSDYLSGVVWISLPFPLANKFRINWNRTEKKKCVETNPYGKANG